MHEKDESVERVVNRRRLLKRAGVLAAGAGAVVAGAVVAAPAAEAATGDPVLQGHANAAGTGSTGLSAGPAANLPTLELANTESAVDGVGNTRAGAPLRLVPNGQLLSDTAPAGSIGITEDGTIWFVQDVGGGQLVRQYIYATANANFTVPLNPDRVIDTRNSDGRKRILTPGALDGFGRVRGGQSIAVDLRDYVFNAFAVYVNLTAVFPVADGFLTAFPTGATQLPPVSNVNYMHTVAAWPNYALVPVGGFQVAPGDVRDSISIFASATVHVIVDISAATVADWGSVNPVHLPGFTGSRTTTAPAKAPKRTAPTWAKTVH